MPDWHIAGSNGWAGDLVILLGLLVFLAGLSSVMTIPFRGPAAKGPVHHQPLHTLTRRTTKS